MRMRSIRLGLKYHKQSGSFKGLKNEIENGGSISKADILSRLDDILNKLSKIHSMMAEK